MEACLALLPVKCSSMVFENVVEWPSFEGQRQIPPPLSSVRVPEAGGRVLRQAWDQYQLPYTLVRPFNCVGIGESRALGDQEILFRERPARDEPRGSRPVQKVLKGQDRLHILGSGDQVRHYTYGGDLAADVVTAMEQEDALNEDFNLSTAEGTTVQQLAGLVWRKTKGDDVPLRLVHDDPFEYDVQRRVPDTGKAKKMLGFEATTTLEEMLDEVIPWIDAAIKAGTI